MFKTGLQLNRITSGQHKTDNNNQVVTLTTNIAFNNKVQWDRQFLITIDQRFPTCDTWKISRGYPDYLNNTH